MILLGGEYRYVVFLRRHLCGVQGGVEGAVVKPVALLQDVLAVEHLAAVLMGHGYVYAAHARDVPGARSATDTPVP